MRSLPKNLSLLEDFFTTVKEPPEIIAISETKLKENNIHNINIPGYSFINTNSRTAAGGVAIYIANELDLFRRCDMELSGDNIESCWVEIWAWKTKERRDWMHLSAPIKWSSALPWNPKGTIRQPKQ